MSKDAKLGLVLGIGLIIIVAVVFFRKEPSQAKASTDGAAAASVKPKGVSSTPVVSDVRPIAPGRRHTVAPGDTLFSLAERYYNDPTRFVLIYDANRDRLAAPDRLEAGTVLVIPD